MGAERMAEYAYHGGADRNFREVGLAARLLAIGNVFTQSGHRFRRDTAQARAIHGWKAERSVTAGSGFHPDACLANARPSNCGDETPSFR